MLIRILDVGGDGGAEADESTFVIYFGQPAG